MDEQTYKQRLQEIRELPLQERSKARLKLLKEVCGDD